MKYAITFVCPPLGLYWSQKPWQMAFCIVLELIALATWLYGIGPILHAICILWALNAWTGHEQEKQVREFMKSGGRRAIRM